MKIALLGYGKMGKAIEVEALKKGHSIILRIDSEKDWEEKENLLPQADVAIEFSMPATAVANIRRCFKAATPVVVGTTGWENKLDLIKQECLDGNNTLFVASNFSLGMNIFFEVNKKLAHLMDRFDQYDVNIEEVHHQHKVDTPSGTAKTLAGQIINSIHRKSGWVSGPTGSKDKLEVISKREGETTGTHTIKYTSEMDELIITHTATNRRVFAIGAILAAEWLQGKQGFFGMSDFLFDSKTE
jgi:4-hydroxy-tetrahydrodipicolinate reductase